MPILWTSRILHARWPIAILGGAFGVAFVTGYALVSPLRDSPIGYDTAASVLYFERLVHGVLLEQPYGATPKPLLTLIDGLLYTVGGWRAISLVAVASYAAVVALGTGLTHRLWRGDPDLSEGSEGGSTTRAAVASGFAFMALLGSAPLLLDASEAYAVSTAAIGCLVAAFAVVGPRPRYAVAGIALGLAALARLETIVVVVGAVAVLAAGAGLARWTHRRPPRTAWWLAMGLIAIPVMLLHDLRLTGDPLYWMHVSERFSVGHPDEVMDPLTTLAWLGRHFVPMALTVGLAGLGVATLAVRRQAIVGAGFAMLCLGILALLLVLAARDTYISLRYLALVDVGLAIPAAIGIAALSAPGLARPIQAARSRAPSLVRRSVPALGAALAMVLALTVIHPFAPIDTRTRRVVFDARTVARHVDIVVPMMRTAMAAQGSFPDGRARIVAPATWTPRLIVDLGLRITDVKTAGVIPDGSAFLTGTFLDGQIVFHDRVGDAGEAAFSGLETGGVVDVGDLRFTTIAADAKAGWWLLRVASAP